MANHIYSIFPTEIFTLETSGIDNDKLANIILNMERSEESWTKHEGWKGSYGLLNHQDFRWVVDFFGDHLGSVLGRYNFREDLDVQISNMWPNVNRPMDINTQHIHAGVNFSFVYYIRIPKDSGGLVIVDPRVMRKMTHEHHLLKDLDDPKTKENITMTPVEGEFIIFPAYLEHYVEPNMSEEPRISISGNIVLERRENTDGASPIMKSDNC